MSNKTRKSPYTNIHIRADTKEKLCAMKHKGQSFDGLFQEMIERLNNICPLCGEFSLNSEAHKECMDREQCLADR